MKALYIGIGEFGVTNSPDDVLKTMALGSCVGLIVLEPRSRTVGMAHIALSSSQINPSQAAKQPGRFADTAIPALLNLVAQRSKTRSGYIIKLAGGAQVASMKDTFNIGKRNILAIKKILWQMKLASVAEDLGGQISRTVTVEVNTGRVIIHSPGRPDWSI
ncbi:MAG: chemotaxis protein CheD [Desulfobulbaceae bacterium]|nr:chemotaxis protein CheD [Desulfobulbaceae bacterium]